MKIYFAGKVPKGDEINSLVDWRARIAQELTAQGLKVVMITPEDPRLDESDTLAVFGHDCYLIKSADLIVVNADSKLGVGTAQEMIIAKYFSKAVVTILPPNTHHRRDNLKMGDFTIPDWKHPFVVSTSDLVVDSVEDLANAIRSHKVAAAMACPTQIDIINASIEHYLKAYPEEK